MLPRPNFNAWVALTKQGFKRALESLDTYSQVAHSPVYVKATSLPTKHQLLKQSIRRFSTRSNNVLFQKSLFSELLVYFGFTSKRALHSVSPYQFGKPVSGYASYGARSPYAVKFSRNGIFPSTLYRSFNQTNARHFSCYTSQATKEAVQNLTAFTRAFFLEAYKLKICQHEAKKRQFVANSSSSSENAQAVLGLIHEHSTANAGSIVEFKLVLPSFSMPAVNFLDESYLESFNSDMTEYQNELAIVQREVAAIFEAFGCLPVSVEKPATELIIRIHFANHDPEYVEQLLKDAGITKGIVYEEGDDTGVLFESVSTGEIVPTVPYDMISDSEVTPSENESYSSAEDIFYPVLSSSGLSGSFQIIPNAIVA